MFVSVTDNGLNLFAGNFREHIDGQYSHVRIHYCTPSHYGLLERFHQTLETEEVHWQLYESPADVRQPLEVFRWRSNEVRSHWALVQPEEGNPVTLTDACVYGQAVQLPKWQVWSALPIFRPRGPPGLPEPVNSTHTKLGSACLVDFGAKTVSGKQLKSLDGLPRRRFPDEPTKAMKLLLEDGTQMVGSCFGALRPTGGEVVFNTGMTGYVETLTDPSYCGQILVATYPLVGNYGIPRPRRTASIERPYESSRIQVQGLVVQNYVHAYSHHAATRSLQEWLIAGDIPAVSGIDTRTLTRRLREFGTMRGWLYPATLSSGEAKAAADSVDMRQEVFHRVAPPEPVRYEGGRTTIIVVDVGAKDNIIRSLLSRGVNVLRVPWHMSLSKFLPEACGVVVGNGPGDPSDLCPLVDQLRPLLADPQMPVLGICLGHQLLARAAGARTYKLPYGHRGVNQPVQDLLTRRCYITSQNHGYAVEDGTLPSDWEPWFINLNDGTNEGVRSRVHPHLSVQFHPEASPGPQDAGFLFDEFLRLAKAK